MSSSTVLRVKRRLEEGPQDALMLMCKRKKTDNEELPPSLFVFCGTVETQELVQVKEILPKTDIKVKPNVESIVQKVRKTTRETSAENRYEIVNCLRGITDCVDSETDIVMTVIDLERGKDKDGDVQYAYDLYTNLEEFDISNIEGYYGVETELVYDDEIDDQLQRRDNGDADEDSNDENNWRNEYPSTEESSEGENIMVTDEELSSDVDEDQIYSECYKPEWYRDTASKYGTAYAEYKARVFDKYPDIADKNCLVQQLSKVQIQKSDDSDDSDDGFYYGDDDVDRKKKGDDDSSENELD